jgi:hypothetical protein
LASWPAGCFLSGRPVGLYENLGVPETFTPLLVSRAGLGFRPPMVSVVRRTFFVSLDEGKNLVKLHGAIKHYAIWAFAGLGQLSFVGVH